MRSCSMSIFRPSELIGDSQPVMPGPYSIFESKHITRASLTGYNLNPGDVFVPKFDSVNRKTRFKKFAFQKISAANGSDDPRTTKSGLR